jgi:hypothetical protein
MSSVSAPFTDNPSRAVTPRARPLVAHRGCVSAVCVSTRHNVLISGGRDSVVYAWAEDPNFTRDPFLDTPFSSLVVPGQPRVADLCELGDGRIAAALGDGNVMLLDFEPAPSPSSSSSATSSSSLSLFPSPPSSRLRVVHTVRAHKDGNPQGQPSDKWMGARAVVQHPTLPSSCITCGMDGRVVRVDFPAAHDCAGAGAAPGAGAGADANDPSVTALCDLHDETSVLHSFRLVPNDPSTTLVVALSRGGHLALVYPADQTANAGLDGRWTLYGMSAAFIPLPTAALRSVYKANGILLTAGDARSSAAEGNWIAGTDKDGAIVGTASAGSPGPGSGLMAWLGSRFGAGSGDGTSGDAGAAAHGQSMSRLHCLDEHVREDVGNSAGLNPEPHWVRSMLALPWGSYLSRDADAEGGQDSSESPDFTALLAAGVPTSGIALTAVRVSGGGRSGVEAFPVGRIHGPGDSGVERLALWRGRLVSSGHGGLTVWDFPLPPRGLRREIARALVVSARAKAGATPVSGSGRGRDGEGAPPASPAGEDALLKRIVNGLPKDTVHIIAGFL